jgi:Type IX secretion system protein PorV
MKKNATLALLLLFVQFSKAQTPISTGSFIPIPSVPGLAIPFFDARHAALGDAGVATSTDYVDIFYNPAKTAFALTKFGFYGAYAPWIVDGMNLVKLGANYKLPDNRSSISVSFTLFNQNPQFASSTGSLLENHNAYDWILGANYAKKISSKLSLGIGLKYIQSSLYLGAILGIQIKPAEAIAADISIFHQSNDSTKLVNLNYGIYISNLSGRVNYGGTVSNFIPTNLKIGIAPTMRISKSSTFTLAIDANKLMIPTLAIDSTGRAILPKSAIAGILGSLGDAPGGLKEELQEIIWSIGGEYWYKNIVALRVGKFIQSENKGGRNYTTFGIGLKIIKKVNIDVARLYDESSNKNSSIPLFSPYGNFWRTNITFGLGKYFNIRW